MALSAYLDMAKSMGLVDNSEYGGYRARNFAVLMFDELVTNCALHKEYDLRSYIGVYVYPDKMTFANHNRPLPPVTIQDLNEREEFDDRDYLNPELRDMFFALDLIESYGSGIRRAKRAMAANGSPALVFTPDNDSDDYTMATAYINEEFAGIRSGEAGGKPASNPTAIRQEGGGAAAPGRSHWQALRGNERAACAYLAERGESRAAEIARDLDIKRRTLGDVLARLADKGIVEPLGQSVSRTYKLLY